MLAAGTPIASRLARPQLVPVAVDPRLIVRRTQRSVKIDIFTDTCGSKKMGLIPKNTDETKKCRQNKESNATCQ
jgi:ribosomal protein L18